MHLSIIKYSRHLIVILLGVFLFSLPCFAPIEINVDPVSDIEITASPGEFEESIPVGFTNQLKCKSNQGPYYIRIISDSANLISGSDTMPISSLKYMCTYVNIWKGFAYEGQGTFTNYQTYVPFPTSYQDVYLTAVDEADTFPNPATIEVQPQFKYAIQVPSDQAPGIYTGTIRYLAIDDSGSPQADVSANVEITVTPTFQLSIDRGTIDFESMLPGQEKDNVPVESIVVTTKTSSGNPWYLKISNNSPLTSGPNIIPNSNFYWYGWSVLCSMGYFYFKNSLPVHGSQYT